MNLTNKDIEWWSQNTVHDIAEEYNISVVTVYKWKKVYDIKVKRKTGSGKKRTGKMISCVVCNKQVYVRKYRQDTFKYCSTKCMGKCEERRDALSKIDKSYMQTEEYSISKRKTGTSAYRRYANKVHSLSNKLYESNKELINPNNHPRTICGVEGGYQLDHVVSVRYGFDNNIPPEEMSTIDNLQMLPWKDNLKKGTSFVD